jgi:hypothetical protein
MLCRNIFLLVIKVEVRMLNSYYQKNVLKLNNSLWTDIALKILQQAVQIKQRLNWVGSMEEWVA